MHLPRVRVVLVRPEEAGNVGAAARVMRNFGIEHLVLVDPRAARPAEARKWARGAEDLLEGADIVPHLDAAVTGCHLAWAATRRRGRDRGTYHTPREAAEETRAALEAGGSVAWVFGPESTGLATAEVDRCTGRVTIPTAPRQPSLNLAQAVAVCCYETAMGQMPPGRRRRLPAPAEEREALYRHWREALDAVGFLRASAGTRLAVLRRLLERARPTAPEVRYLRGIARRVRWAGEHARPRTGSSSDPEE